MYLDGWSTRMAQVLLALKSHAKTCASKEFKSVLGLYVELVNTGMCNDQT